MERTTYNEINQIQFSRSVVANRTIKVLNGYGISVDKQKDELAERSFMDVLSKLYPDHSIKIIDMGRFGYDKNTGWQFDVTMATSGHPSNWIPDSRGYYVSTKNTVFIFPKDDYGFEKYEQNLIAQIQRKQKMIAASYENDMTDKENFFEIYLKKVIDK